MNTEIFYGEQQCKALKISGERCVNRAYFLNSDNQVMCGFHSKINERVELPRRSEKERMFLTFNPRIKEERLADFHILVKKNLEKFCGQRITFQNVHDAISSVLLSMIDDPSNNFQTGLILSRDNLYTSRIDIPEIISVNSCNIDLTELLSSNLNSSTNKDSNTSDGYRANLNKTPKVKRPDNDYTFKVTTKKEDFIPKIKKFYQDEVGEKYKYELENQVKLYKHEHNSGDETDDDNSITEEKEVEIPENVLTEFKEIALTSVYDFYTKHKPIVFKGYSSNAKTSNAKTKAKEKLQLKHDTANKLIKEFISSNYDIVPSNIKKGSQSCDIYNSYVTWMKQHHSNEIIQCYNTFSRALGNAEMIGQHIIHYNNGKKRCWGVVPKQIV